ncbi:hypothetical protein EJ04DRAFT_563301 [Polyplosphaeria fusca]|uniref:Uncharacterized protein n=1 Tax=Polyplosphaeria fusca TaxID=682080 RepID=A0A9P4V4K4_9PLEO|nr:hypothetical protein EJ04DRAFT_563301 [Polyplosphaeria fusca]
MPFDISSDPYLNEPMLWWGTDDPLDDMEPTRTFDVVGHNAFPNAEEIPSRNDTDRSAEKASSLKSRVPSPDGLDATELPQDRELNTRASDTEIEPSQGFQSNQDHAVPEDTEVTAIPVLEAVSPVESSMRAAEIESNHSIQLSYDRTASEESDATNIMTLPTEAEGTDSNEESGASHSPITTWDDELSGNIIVDDNGGRPITIDDDSDQDMDLNEGGDSDSESNNGFQPKRSCPSERSAGMVNGQPRSTKKKAR